MSSYQFVNSLANCYGAANGQQQQQQRGAAGVGADQSALAAVAAVHAAAASQDYYGASSGYAAAAAAGPPPGAANCYSPQVSPHHYGPYAPAAAAPTPQTHPLQGGTAADYNPQLAAAAAHQRLSAATGLQSTTSPGAPTPPSATPVNSSCKYADSTASSPQDLSTSSGNTPAPQASRSPADPAAVAAAAAAGHQSSASSTASNNNSGGSSGKGPPHIYPWMKRVHLGTSEYF